MPARKTPAIPNRRAPSRNLRNRLVRKLPAMLDAAIAAYQQIALTAPSDDPKSFAAAHTGAKAALAHIEQIIRIAESAIAQDTQASTSGGGSSDQIEALLNAARSALGNDPEHHDPDDSTNDAT